ncbi:MAG: hypothetical protein EXR68_07185 [Dehalococcoidia bacterium]|nr:hypothetical protein [Dehalococcoidia bacterium]
MTRVVFVELGRPLLAIAGALGLIMATLILLITNQMYALLPIAMIGGGIWYMVRRDRRAAREAEAALPSPYSPPQNPPPNHLPRR